MRVVSLNCSNTEIVCALGCADLLVGVDRDSDFPADVVARLPRVGRDLEIDMRAVQALRPDLVLASLTVPGHDRVVERLAATGLPHYAPATKSLDDTYADIAEIGARLGVPDRAAALVHDMRRRIAPCPPPGQTRPRVLVQWWPKPVIAPGRRSWVHQLIELTGACNVLGDRDVESQPIDDAAVAALAPDLIVISWCGVKTEKYRPDVVLGNPLWREVPAVAAGRVASVPEAFLGRPGPRLVEGHAALRRLVVACATRS
ncbi:MAG: helical backbone metal receptor [Planctomycetota bacterium]